MSQLQEFIENMANLCLDQSQYAYFITILCSDKTASEKNDFKIESVLKSLFGETQATTTATANEPFEQLMKFGFIFRADQNYTAVNQFSVQDSTRFIFDPEKFLYVQAARLQQVVSLLKRNETQIPQGDFICAHCQSQFTLKQVKLQKNRLICDECGVKALKKVVKQVRQYSMLDTFSELFQEAIYLVNLSSEDIESIKTQYNSIKGDYKEKLELLKKEMQSNSKQVNNQKQNVLNVQQIFQFQKLSKTKQASFQKVRLQQKQLGLDVKSIYRGKQCQCYSAKRLYLLSDQSEQRPFWFQSVEIRAKKLIKGENIK
ncbi:hypothetical protein SS50377_23433 [Spironucleus salmonicida]|uniref:Uncharacterized protein n=1 Tax=Spironucleus salmonicida TaxID=348837 RepID=V6LNJ9_9EUKA|nr:hypothetical protein SS50377_23433 [Spironucleus salmonicida]|eukprot:EST46170.1 Hypothetical protein SS50377_13763 [Spironucleus salmonicida]